MGVAGFDVRTKFRGAFGAQADMRSQQRVAVALRSVAQRLRQGRRLDRLIDLGKFVEVVARAMGQGDRNTVGRHPTMLLTILQHADSAFPSGSFAFSNGIEGLAAMNAPLDRSGLRAQIVQSRISSASASDEMTRRSRINAPIRAR